MLKSFRHKIAAVLASTVFLAIPALSFGVASAAACPAGQTGTPPNCAVSTSSNLQNDLGCGATFTVDPSASCATSTTAGAGKVQGVVTTIVDYFSVIVGLIAVVMLIYGGLKYITSGGDSGKAASARTAIVSAVIGLVIVALAQFIVQFVLSKVTNAGSNS